MRMHRRIGPTGLKKAVADGKEAEGIGEITSKFPG